MTAHLAAVHAIDALWCDAMGVYVRGWAHAGAEPLLDARLASGRAEVTLWPLAPRPDVRAAYPAMPSDECGFSAYLNCAPFRPVTLVLTTPSGHIAIDVVAPIMVQPVPAAPVEDPFDGFVRQMKQRGGTVLEIGARVVGPVSTLLAPLFSPECRHLGMDIHPAAGVDIVADAHFLSSAVAVGSLSGVFSRAVLEHIAAPWLVAAEINRVLAIGGVTYHLVPQTFPVHEMPNDFWRYTDEALKVLFGPATGFEVLDAAMSAPARIHPAPSWRAPPFLEMPLHYGMAAAHIVARKVSDLAAGAVMWPGNPEGLGTLSRHYPRHPGR